MMQKCSIGASLWLKQSARISVNTIRLSSSKVVHSSDKDATKDSTPPPNIEKLSRRDYRYIFPEFLPDPNPEFRNSVSEKLARKDMIARRDKLEVPGQLYILKLVPTYHPLFRVLCWYSDGRDCVRHM